MGYHLAQRVKHLLAMQESWIRSLGWEYPLEKEMVTHSSILAWKIPWMEEPGTLQSMGLLRVRHDNKRVQKAVLGCNLKKQKNDLCSFPRQTIQYHNNPSLYLNQ